MSQATTAILYAPGINCHEETAAALEWAGGKGAELVLLSDLLGGRARLDHYQAAVVPGGFSYGDHLGAGRIFATLLVARLRDQLVEFLRLASPCWGLQRLSGTGGSWNLTGPTPGKRTMALLENQSARFEDRKIRLSYPARNVFGPRTSPEKHSRCPLRMAKGGRSFAIREGRAGRAWSFITLTSKAGLRCSTP